MGHRPVWGTCPTFQMADNVILLQLFEKLRFIEQIRYMLYKSAIKAKQKGGFMKSRFCL